MPPPILAVFQDFLIGDNKNDWIKEGERERKGTRKTSKLGVKQAGSMEFKKKKVLMLF